MGLYQRGLPQDYEAGDDTLLIRSFLDAMEAEGGIRILPVAAYEEIAFARDA